VRGLHGGQQALCGDAHLEARHVFVQLRRRTAVGRGSGSEEREREGGRTMHEKKVDKRLYLASVSGVGSSPSFLMNSLERRL